MDRRNAEDSGLKVQWKHFYTFFHVENISRRTTNEEVVPKSQRSSCSMILISILELHNFLLQLYVSRGHGETEIGG